jgi:type I restriction enzyme, R subunit
MADFNEYKFEQELCEALETQGWLYSKSDAGYDVELALFPADLLAWLADTQPQEFSKVVKAGDSETSRAKAQNALVQRLAKSLDLPLANGGGALNILRKGFKDGSAKFEMCQFKPADSLNAATLEKYSKVRLRVMRQVHYSKKNRNSIDLVFFVNGIPVATLELKTDFTQNVEDAKTQYKKDRNPKGEPLLTFGHRALVHFAVSNDEVWMTTKLAGEATYFLPFNKGDNGRAGNPVNPDSSKTSYLWEDVFQRDNWLQIIGRFMHLSIEDSIDPVTGVKERKESLLFPRYHQWQSVTKLVEAARAEGAGNKYLIQHSAGSGKTNSIAWTAHQLSTLHSDSGSKVFDSVIVVTDRTVLDDQLSSAIKQIENKTGVVAVIDNKNGSKSSALADALASNKPIITVTMQTFPFILKQIQETASAKGKTFAIIADEAHSSQTGNTASELKKVLSDEDWKSYQDGGEVDVEDVLAAEMANRADPKNISFFAYTATPKAKTMELFGRVGESGKPEPFHVYTMQQAIEEGFILDVLQNYTPYKLAFKLTHNGEEYDSESISKEVDQSEALKELMHWVRLHPTNIGSKVSIIVEHFRQNVAWRLDGKAKAMVVTGSRKEAVRYKLVFDKYIAEMGYKNLNALVAFSGDVEDPETSPTPYTEANMNPGLRGRKLAEAFKGDDYQVMLVANKFQTGFDQPLLVAMYVDKKLSGVTAVQTLSRLNRTAKGKDVTYILDFVNEPQEILEAFQPYFRDAQLTDITDQNLVNDIERKLDHSGIYDLSEVEEVARTFVLKKGNNKLSASLAQVKDRFWKKFEAATKASDRLEIDRLEDFRKTLLSFTKTYDFLSQIYNYEDTSLEKKAIFYRLLSREIRDNSPRETIDLDGVELAKLGFRKSDTVKLDLGSDEGALKPLTAAGTGVAHDPVLTTIKEAIEQMNHLFDDEGLTNGDFEGFITYVAAKAGEESKIQDQAKANTLERFLESPDLRPILLAALFAATGNFQTMGKELAEDDQKLAKLIEIVGRVLHKKLTTTDQG